MTSTPPPNPASDTDPRLLLPEWLRDEPAAERAAAAAAPSRTAEAVTQPAPSEPDSPKSGWQEPPRAVERYDPSGLIASDDLPAWIRGVVDSGEARAEPPPATGAAAAVAAAETPPQQVEAVAERSAAVTEPEPDRAQPAKQSDLTETRFVLLAGAALVILLALLARFYL
ncbi:MAG: hypothetical protein KF883_07265 [Thermomicrobiales bacterium]|nr:hypothetical protein [Thermomicrobiales bacterium]